jgi:hypothetical protein
MTLEPTGNNDGSSVQPSSSDANQPGQLKKAAVIKKAAPPKKANAPQKTAPLKKAALLEPLPGEPAEPTTSSVPEKPGPRESTTSPAATATAKLAGDIVAVAPAARAPDPVYMVNSDEEEGAARSMFASWESYSAGGVSMLVHMILILILGLWGLDLFELKSAQMSAIADTVVVEDLVEEDESILDEEVIIKEIIEPEKDMDDPITIESPLEDAEDNSNLALLEENEDISDLLANTDWMNDFNVPLGNLLDANPAGEGAPNGTGNSVVRVGGTHLGGRAARRAKVEIPEAEEAVNRGLTWLAKHQHKDGSWSFDHARHPDCRGRCKNPGDMTKTPLSATGLALLPFLGAGYTHQKGPFKETVGKGLVYLMRNMRVDDTAWDGSLWDRQATMYGHGICTLVLCEAYGMTKQAPESLTDGAANGIEEGAFPIELEKLKIAADKASHFIQRAQGPGGGWRYMPHDMGDTSVLGWQLMALMAAKDAGLRVNAKVGPRVNQFLARVEAGIEGDNVYGRFGTKYAYDMTKKRFSKATNTIGILSRLFMGVKAHHPAVTIVASKIAVDGPDPGDMYYNYYANQVMFQFGGQQWEDWQKKITAVLIKAQVKDGHAVGTWYFDEGDQGATKGGRVYCTSLALMCLEEHYRHLRISKSAEELAEQFAEPDEKEDAGDDKDGAGAGDGEDGAKDAAANDNEGDAGQPDAEREVRGAANEAD